MYIISLRNYIMHVFRRFSRLWLRRYLGHLHQIIQLLPKQLQQSRGREVFYSVKFKTICPLITSTRFLYLSFSEQKIMFYSLFYKIALEVNMNLFLLILPPTSSVYLNFYFQLQLILKSSVFRLLYFSKPCRTWRPKKRKDPSQPYLTDMGDESFKCARWPLKWCF